MLSEGDNSNGMAHAMRILMKPLSMEDEDEGHEKA